MRLPSGSPTKCRPAPIRFVLATPASCTGSIDTTAWRSYRTKSPVPASGGASPWRCCRCCRSSGCCELAGPPGLDFADQSADTIFFLGPIYHLTEAADRALALREARSPALSHPACELVHVEIVTPGADLAFTDLECPHDRQFKRLRRQLEDVHPLGHHDRTIGCDVDDAELDALDAWRARADERCEVVGDGLPAGDRRQGDVVVDGVVGEECRQVVGPHAVGPRCAEPAHHLDRPLHLAPPAVELRRTLTEALEAKYDHIVQHG